VAILVAPAEKLLRQTAGLHGGGPKDVGDAMRVYLAGWQEGKREVKRGRRAGAWVDSRGLLRLEYVIMDSDLHVP
jgi:hypothetical protein